MKTDNSKGNIRQIIERPRNKKELADLLGVSVKVLRKMIAAVENELGEPIGGVYCVNQVVFMVEKYGLAKAS
jgi:hypothetical protein